MAFKKHFCAALFTAVCRLNACVSVFPQLPCMLSVSAVSTAPDCIVCIVALPHLAAKCKSFLIYMSPISLFGPWNTDNQSAMLYARSPPARVNNLEAAKLMNLSLRLKCKKSN